jgi:hypothetical protein
MLAVSGAFSAYTETQCKFWLVVAGPLVLPVSAALIVFALSSLGEYAVRSQADLDRVRAGNQLPAPPSRVDDAGRDDLQRGSGSASPPPTVGIGAVSERPCASAATTARISRTAKTSSAVVRPLAPGASSRGLRLSP